MNSVWNLDFSANDILPHTGDSYIWIPNLRRHSIYSTSDRSHRSSSRTMGIRLLSDIKSSHCWPVLTMSINLGRVARLAACLDLPPPPYCTLYNITRTALHRLQTRHFPSLLYIGALHLHNWLGFLVSTSFQPFPWPLCIILKHINYIYKVIYLMIIWFT